WHDQPDKVIDRHRRPLLGTARQRRAGLPLVAARRRREQPDQRPQPGGEDRLRRGRADRDRAGPTGWFPEISGEVRYGSAGIGQGRLDQRSEHDPGYRLREGYRGVESAERAAPVVDPVVGSGEPAELSDPLAAAVGVEEATHRKASGLFGGETQ